MKVVLRRIPATLILTSLVVPWAMGVAAPHWTGPHHHHGWADRDHAEAVELVVHGHHHEQGTPEHQHSFVVTKPAARITKVSFAQDLASSIHPGTALADPVTRLVSAHVDPAHGPPRFPQISPTLRI